MPRAFDKYPTQRGLGGDSLYSPTRGGLPWQNPLEAITGTAADTVTAIGNVIREWLALDQFDLAFTEFGEAILDLDWTSPDAVRGALAAAGKLIADLAAWAAQVFQNITKIDLTGQTGFVHDLIELLAIGQLAAAWDTFITGWSALNWANPITAMHPAWKLLVDFGRALTDWALQALANLTGISLPGFLALDELRGHWNQFFTAWDGINWSHPLTGIHTAWMATVDLVWNLVAWAQTVLANLTGIIVPNFFDTDVITGLWQGFTAAWQAITWGTLTAIWSAIKAVGALVRGTAHWAIGVLRNLTGIDLEPVAASFGIGALADAITAWADTLIGINWLADPIGGLMTAIGAFVKLAQDLGNWILGVIDAWIGWGTDTVHEMFASFDNFVGGVIEYFFGSDGRAFWEGALAAISGAGATILGAITGAYNGIMDLVGLIGQFLNFGQLIEFIASILGEDGLLGWLANLPFIGPLVTALTGVQPNGDTALDLSTLGIWAQGLLTGRSPIPGGNIVGSISSAIMSVIPVAHISADSPNLLSQGNFNNDFTVADGSGWSWDGTTTATGTGGSVKVVATGDLQELFSRQAVKVNGGDRVDITCRVKTSGFTAGSGRSMVLSVIPWTLVGGVMTQQSTVTIATRTASAASWQDMAGTTYTVPAGVVRIQVRLAVTANSGASIWFDDAKVAKGGELGQHLVDSLITAWNDLWGGLTNPVAGQGGTTGKTWQDLFGGAAAFRGSYNTEKSRGDTLRLNLFGSPSTVGTVVSDGAIPDIGLGKSNAMQSIVNNLYRGLFGSAPANSTTDDVLTAAERTAQNVAAVKSSVADLQAKAASGLFSGEAQAVDFSAFSDGSLPSGTFTVNASVWTGSPSGSGYFGVRSGRAAYITSGLDNRRSIAVHNTPTKTSWQRVGVVLATAIASYGSTSAAVYLGGRTNSTGTVGVFARLTASNIQIVDGSGNVLATASPGAAFPGTYWFDVGVGAAQNRVRVWWESFCLLDQTFGSLPDGGLRTAVGVEARTYTRPQGTFTALPGEIASFAFYDSKPADVLGSIFRAGRSSTTAQSVGNTTVYGDLLPGGFFSGPDQLSSDLTWDSATNKLTVSVSGPYLVVVALKRDGEDPTESHAAAIFKNGAVNAVGTRQMGLSSIVSSGTRSQSIVSVPVYLEKNDYIQPGYIASGGVSLIGSAGGIETYMAVAFLGNTKPAQPVAA